MSFLLTKRLARSLWRTKIRLVAVIFMVVIGVLGGISMGGYATNVAIVYDTIYEDNENGVNLPDVWVNLPVGTWSDQESQNLCNNFEEDFPVGSPRIDKCEPRLVLDGTLFHTNKLGNEVLVTAVWHGTDEGEVDKVWIPDHECCEGRIAQSPTEIVIDVRAAEDLDISVGSSVSLGAGEGRINFTVVGIGYHSNHFWFAPEGSLFPAEAGTYVTGYMTNEGLEKLTNLTSGSSNKILIDLVFLSFSSKSSSSSMDSVSLSSTVARAPTSSPSPSILQHVLNMMDRSLSLKVVLFDFCCPLFPLEILASRHNNIIPIESILPFVV